MARDYERELYFRHQGSLWQRLIFDVTIEGTVRRKIPWQVLFTNTEKEPDMTGFEEHRVPDFVIWSTKVSKELFNALVLPVPLIGLTKPQKLELQLLDRALVPVVESYLYGPMRGPSL